MNLLDAIPPSAAPETAVLDAAGVVCWVNDAWTRFAHDNGAPAGWTGIGSNYLTMCADAGDPPSLAVARALRAALRGELAGWAAVEVPCHSPTEQRWFDVLICPRLDDAGQPVGATVVIARLTRDDEPGQLPAPPGDGADGPVLGSGSGSSDHLDHPDDSAQRPPSRGPVCLLEDYPDPLLGVDGTGRLVAVNQALCRLFGRSSDELIGATVEQLLPPGSQAVHRRLREGYLSAPRRRPMGLAEQVLYGRHADGHLIPVRVSLTPAEIDGRAVVLAAVRDESEQVADHARTHLVADLLDVTADAIVVHAAADLRPVWANRTMAELTGYPVQDLLSDPAASTVLDLPAVREASAELIDGRTPEVYFSAVVRGRNGRRVPVDVQLSYRERAVGEGYLVAVRRDASARQRVQAERERRAALNAAASEVRLAVLLGHSTGDCLSLVCRRAAELAGVRSAAIWLPSRRPDEVTLGATSGDLPEDLTGRTYPTAGTVLALALQGGDGVQVGDPGDPDCPGRTPRPLPGLSDPGRVMAVRLVTNTQLIGVLTLTRDEEGPVDQDEADRLAEFGTQVGVALESGQLRRDLDREAAVVAASAEILLALLSSRPMAECLDLVCLRATTLLDADVATVLTPAPDGEALLAVASSGSEPVSGPGASTVSINDTAWRTIRTGDPAVGTTIPAPGQPVPGSGQQRPAQELLAAPLRAGTGRIGALVVVRAAGQGFSARQIQTLSTFASYAATSLEVGRLRVDRERLARLEERERIARDLHDSVIQDLFAGGLRLSSALKYVHEPTARQRVQEAVEAMDGAIAQLRATIFRISEPDQLLSVRALLESAAESRTPQLGYRPHLEVSGDPETLPSHVVTELIQIITEALSNTARHADSTAAQVQLAVGPHGMWQLDIHDNGIGFDPQSVRGGHGLANIATRAALLGASLSIRSVDGDGTRIELDSSPLPPSSGAHG